MSNQEDEPLTLTVPEAAKLLRIGRATAYEAVKTGTLPSLKFGRRVVIPYSALERLLNEGTGDHSGIGDPRADPSSWGEK